MKKRRHLFWLFVFVIILGFVIRNNGSPKLTIPKLPWTSPQATPQTIKTSQGTPTDPTPSVA